jgi:flavorubredoxin
MLSIDLLYYEDYAHYKEAAQALREVLEEENVLAEVYMVSVSPGEDAETRGLIGSPTVLF